MAISLEVKANLFMRMADYYGMRAAFGAPYWLCNVTILDVMSPTADMSNYLPLIDLIFYVRQKI